MKFSLDKTLIDLPPNDGSATAIEICYCRRDYVIPLNDRALNILGWDAYLEKECEEEIESFLAIGSFNLFSEDLDDPFYS
ncbi:MAG: hypothetical protein P8I55_11250 [Crocinitomix sp.]|nr:hypothetical protein [Crocinitomix sp.]